MIPNFGIFQTFLFPSWIVGLGIFGLFNKKISQSSNTTNQDNSRTTTLTDSLNTWLSQNYALTQAESRVYNTAFDATDSFNTVNTFNIANVGPGQQEIPAFDFLGLRDFFTDPSKLLNANTVSKDTNENKYDFDFARQSEGGSAFLEEVQKLTRETWGGLARATNAAATPVSGGTGNTSLLIWGLLAILGVLVIVRLFK